MVGRRPWKTRSGCTVGKARAAQRFATLVPEGQAQLIAFLKTLRAP
jgi:hypothetical protein